MPQAVNSQHELIYKQFNLLEIILLIISITPASCTQAERGSVEPVLGVVQKRLPYNTFILSTGGAWGRGACARCRAEAAIRSAWCGVSTTLHSCQATAVRQM